MGPDLSDAEAGGSCSCATCKIPYDSRDPEERCRTQDLTQEFACLDWYKEHCAKPDLSDAEAGGSCSCDTCKIPYDSRDSEERCRTLDLTQEFACLDWYKEHCAKSNLSKQATFFVSV